MKIKYLSLAVLILIFSSVFYAQSATIIAKKQIYTRKPQEGFEHKKTFSVVYPKVSGLAPTLNKKVENALSYERVFDFKMQEEIDEIFWLEEANYKIVYNKNGVLSAALIIDGLGAYPSQSVKHVVVDLKTGETVKPADVFTKLSALKVLADRSLQARIKKEIAEMRKSSAEDARTMSEELKDESFSLDDFDGFSVDDRGVTFYYNYGFPHVIQALEPNNAFFFAFRQLKPYIKPNGLLAKFVR